MAESLNNKKALVQNAESTDYRVCGAQRLRPRGLFVDFICSQRYGRELCYSLDEPPSAIAVSLGATKVLNAGVRVNASLEVSHAIKGKEEECMHVALFDPEAERWHIVPLPEKARAFYDSMR